MLDILKTNNAKCDLTDTSNKTKTLQRTPEVLRDVSARSPRKLGKIAYMGELHHAQHIGQKYVPGNQNM